MSKAIKLPKNIPLHRWFYDGALQKKMIGFIVDLSNGDGDIDFDDPKLQAALKQLSNRIDDVEDTVVDAQPIPMSVLESMFQ